ncbi:MAG: aldo/keto reductase [Patescibacteria group bacterium]|nr:aldo/keto reductase [Patescibacteria group bacterium]
MHRYPGSDSKLKECLKALAELKDENLIKNIGISNFNLEHTKQACEWSKYPVVATQVHYNLQFREPEKTDLLDFCQNNDIMLIAWRPVNKAYQAKNKINFTKPGIPVLDEISKEYKKPPPRLPSTGLFRNRMW